MKERPILMSAWSVRRLLAGAKTQTRRVIEPQPKGNNHIAWHRDNFARGGRDYWALMSHWGNAIEEVRCPYGVSGDRLWVRETFCPLTKGAAYKADDLYIYAPGDRWHPSIHMPRKLSRITLELTGVRAERVQDISDNDIRAEGVDCPEHDFGGGFCAGPRCEALRGAWRVLWGDINAKRGFGWEANPWVWVLKFPRHR